MVAEGMAEAGCGIRRADQRLPPRTDAQVAEVECLTREDDRARFATFGGSPSVAGISAMIWASDAEPAPLPVMRRLRLRKSAAGTAACAPAEAPI